MPPSSCFAEVEQTPPGKIPIVTPRELTPETLHTFEMYCKSYFLNKDVPKDEQVEKIAMALQDVRMQNWYMTNEARINTMTFKAYMAEL